MSRPSVLCIDDNILLLAIRKALLESRDFKVFTAENGSAGLAIVNREPIDVVILDYQMPGIDGGTIAKELRRRRPDIAILLSSGWERIPESVLTIVDSVVVKGGSSAAMIKEIERVTTVRSRPPEQISSTDTGRKQRIERPRGRVMRSKQSPRRCHQKRGL